MLAPAGRAGSVYPPGRTVPGMKWTSRKYSLTQCGNSIWIMLGEVHPHSHWPPRDPWVCARLGSTCQGGAGPTARETAPHTPTLSPRLCCGGQESSARQGGRWQPGARGCPSAWTALMLDKACWQLCTALSLPDTGTGLASLWAGHSFDYSETGKMSTCPVTENRFLSTCQSNFYSFRNSQT